MKIKIEDGHEKSFLPNGRHVVTITEVTDGVSENKGVPFFTCRFENDEGYITSRFYHTDPGLPGIIELFKASEIEVKKGSEMNTKNLLNKSVSIEVKDRSYDDPNTGQAKTIKEAVNITQSGKAATSGMGK